MFDKLRQRIQADKEALDAAAAAGTADVFDSAIDRLATSGLDPDLAAKAREDLLKAQARHLGELGTTGRQQDNQ